MPENKSLIGTTWDPKLPLITSNAAKASTSQNPLASLGSTLWRPENELVDGLFVPPKEPKKLNKLMKKHLKDTAGASWFDMPAQTITPELKNDLQILKLRSVIDPKRHYKKGDLKSKTLPKYFQVGTVIESASEFFSGRLTKKERKATLADELLSDNHLGTYRKRKVREIGKEHNVVGVEKWKIKGKQSLKRKKRKKSSGLT